MANEELTVERTEDPPRGSEISRELIAELGDKLDDFARGLSHEERFALACAFTLAGRGLASMPGGVACEGGLRIAVGYGKVNVERLSSAPLPKASHALTDAFCRAGDGRYSIDGLEVESSRVGSKSVAAGSKSVAAGSKSVAASAGAKSVAACASPSGFPMGAKSVAAGGNFGCRGAKSVAAGGNFGCRGAKSVAAGGNFGCRGAKSVAAGGNFGCRGAKSVAAGGNLGCRGAKSVAAGGNLGCRGAKSVAAFPNFGCRGAKSVAAATPGTWR